VISNNKISAVLTTGQTGHWPRPPSCRGPELQGWCNLFMLNLAVKILVGFLALIWLYYVIQIWRLGFHVKFTVRGVEYLFNRKSSFNFFKLNNIKSRSYPSGASKRRAECERKKKEERCQTANIYDILSSQGQTNLSKVFEVEVG